MGVLQFFTVHTESNAIILETDLTCNLYAVLKSSLQLFDLFFLNKQPHV